MLIDDLTPRERAAKDAEKRAEALYEAATKARLTLADLADEFEAADDIQTAHYLRHRVDALDTSLRDIDRARIWSMSESDLRTELAARGIDHAGAKDLGSILQRLLDEHRAAFEAKRRAEREADSEVDGPGGYAPDELVEIGERLRAKTTARENAGIAEVHTLRQPHPMLIGELASLLGQARTGELRGLLYVVFRNGSDINRFGNVGEYSLADFALGLKLMEVEFDSIVVRAQEPNED